MIRLFHFTKIKFILAGICFFGSNSIADTLCEKHLLSKDANVKAEDNVSKANPLPTKEYLRISIEMREDIDRQFWAQAAQWAAASSVPELSWEMYRKAREIGLEQGLGPINKSLKIIDLKKLMLMRTPVVDETLRFMEDHLQLWSKHNWREFSVRVDSYISKMSAQIVKFKSGERLNYLHFLVFSEAFSELADCDLHRSAGDLAGKNSCRIEIIENNFDLEANSAYSRGCSHFPMFRFYLPSTRSWGFTTLLDGQSAGVHFVGVTDKVEVVDGKQMWPGYFFAHDIGHPASSNTKSEDRRRLEKIFATTNSIQFRRMLKDFSFRSGHSKQFARYLEAIQFYCFHEISPDSFYPEYLVKCLSRTEPANLFPRLQSIDDLGQGFVQPVDFTEFQSAWAALVRFLSSTYPHLRSELMSRW